MLWFIAVDHQDFHILTIMSPLTAIVTSDTVRM
jgi:hypothetical protein